MRIPHHLSRSETGRWSFVQRVPVDLQAVLDCRLIKRTLRTKDLAQAHVRAVVLGAGYARLFAQLKDQRVAKLSKTDADLLIDRLTSAENLRELTLNRTRATDGTVTEQWQIDSPKDLKLYRQLMELEAMAATLQQPEAAHRGPAREIWPQVPRAPAAPPAQAIETVSLGKARDAFLATLKGSTLPKTYTIKKTAIEALVAFLGAKAKVHAITRSDLARWYQDMRETNITDDGDKDDHSKPFEHRNAPPIRIWRYLVEQKNVDPAKVAIYADLKFADGNKPDALNLFSKGESDFDEFQAGDFQHIIFNQGLQEGWDDPACYLGYIDKSMGSQIKVEQIIGRVLRQYDAKHYDSPLLNSAHFFLRVDKKNVFTESIEAVRAKLQESGAAIEIVHTYGGGDGGSEDLAPKEGISVLLHQVHADADDAVVAIAELVAQFPTFKEGEIDTQGDAHSKTETVDISDLAREIGHDWTASGHANRVRLRWLVSNAIRGRSRAALAVVDLKASKFDVRVEAGSNAAAAADTLAREIVSTYYQLTSLVYESELEFTFSTMRVPKKAQAFENGLYPRYAGLNKFEAPFAAALDKAGHTWHRNPSNGGFRIPLLSEGDSASFSPDFLVWKGKYVFCLDTKGSHLLTDAVARKLFDIQDEGATKLLTRFISEGKQTAIGGKATRDGYTVWKMKGGSPTPIHVSNLDQAVKECLKS